MSAPPSAYALVTGFTPFRHWARNPSGEAALALAGERIAARVLPVDHAAAAAALLGSLAALKPEIVLLTGLADEPRLRLEVCAHRPQHLAEGAAALHGVWPWAAALDAMRATGAPARLSTAAGRYVCETVYWTALAQAPRPALVAFLHVPPLSDAWPLERIAAAMRACLATARSTRDASAVRRA